MMMFKLHGSVKTKGAVAVACSDFVRPVNHRLLLLMLGRNAASTPIIRPTKMNVTSAAIQLLSRHHGRNDHVAETSEAAGQVDAQTQSPNTIAAATNPAIKPTTAPFLMFGYMMRSIRLTLQIRGPAPMVLDCLPERHRRVRWVWLVGLRHI
jgi:hypothetical protein